MRIVEVEADDINLSCNRHAKNQPADITDFSFFKKIGVHSFLCSGAQKTVQKISIKFFIGDVSGFLEDFLCSGWMKIKIY